MKLALLATLFTALASAQTISINIGGKIQQFNVPAPVVTVSSMTCTNPDGTVATSGAAITLPAYKAGDQVPQSTCTLNLSFAPSAPFTITPFTADSPLILTPNPLVIPAGTMTIAFFVTRPPISSASTKPTSTVTVASK